MAEYFDGCEVKRESPSGKALLIFVPDIDTEPVWVPKSVIHDDSQVYRDGDEGTLAVKTWFCEREGWI